MAADTDLLVIDADAELDRLCCAQLQGAWQLPAELVRCALRLGAREVRVELRRHGLNLTALDGALPRAAAAALRTAVDRHRSVQDRHRALVEVERAGLLPVLAVSALGARGVLAGPGDDGIEVVTLGRRPPRSTSTTGGGLDLRVRGLTYSRRRARRWLLQACRFSPRTVRVDGARVGGAPGTCLAQGRLTTPVPAWLAVPAAGDVPRLWLLDHGVVAARATVHGQPAFWAAVEMAGCAPAGASAATLRRAVGPHLPDLLHAAGGLLLDLGRRLGELPEAAASRVRGLLLVAAETGLRRREVESVPLLRLITGGADADEWRSLTELRAAAAEGHPLRVVPPGADPQRLLGEGELGVVLSEAQGERLAAVTGMRLARVPEGRERWTGGVWEAVRRAPSAVVGRLRAPRVAAAHELSAAESVLAAVLREALGGGERQYEVVLVDGRGGMRCEGTRVLVPRGNGDVRRAAKAVNRDPDTAYAAAALLLHEVGEPAAGIRRRYLRRMMNPSETRNEV